MAYNPALLNRYADSLNTKASLIVASYTVFFVVLYGVWLYVGAFFHELPDSGVEAVERHGQSREFDRIARLRGECRVNLRRLAVRNGVADDGVTVGHDGRSGGAW